jgi:hypothetical protein
LRELEGRRVSVIRVALCSGAGTICGILVVNAGGNLLTWRGRESRGEVFSVPMAQAQSTFQGKPRDLLVMDRKGSE